MSALFWTHTDRTGDCWNWTGYRMPSGYGQFVLDGRTWLAHRAAYTLAVGPIPAELTLDHLCGNRSCVRPDHLEPVTMRENVLRSSGPAAVNARKRSCSNGHPFTGSNTRIERSRDKSYRRCRACESARNATRTTRSSRVAQR